MELNVFIRSLEEAIIKRGITPDVAEKHIHTLQRTFTDDDLREIKNIQSADEIEDIAESIALLLKKNKITPAAKTPAVSADALNSEPVSLPDSPPKQGSQLQKPAPFTKNPFPPRDLRNQRTENRPVRQYNKDCDDTALNQGSGKGVYIFWLTFIFTLPITISLAAAFFSLFIGAFVGLSALIVALVAGLIALVAVGAGVSLVGIIFGVTQLFSFAAAGIYEIGLGVMVIGTVMLAGILIYNAAIRFLPWLICKVAVLLRFTCEKIRDLFRFLRRECYKL